MPVISCGGGMWRIGKGKCMYDSKEKAERAYRGYLGSKSEASLDKPYPYEWRSRQSYSWVGRFFTDAGLEYRMSVDMEHSDIGEGYDEEIWAWQFYVDNHKYGVTGTGDAGKVFATVFRMFEEFNKHIKPAVVMLESKESSRTKLYERMVKKYAPRWGFDKTEKHKVGNEHAFLLINTHLQDIDRREQVAASLAEFGLAVCHNIVASNDIQYPESKPQGLTTFIASYNPSTRSGRIDMVDVHPDYTRQGIAKKAVLEFEHWVKEQGGKNIIGHALPRSVSFWEALRYKVVKRSSRLGGITQGFKMSKRI